MSYMKNRKSGNAKRDTWIVIIFLIVVVAVIAALIWFFASPKQEQSVKTETTAAAEQDIAEMPFDVPGFTMLQDAPCGRLNDYFYVSCMGSYSGMFFEDGLDEPVENVLAIVVKNISSELVEYGVITADCGGETATFELSGLPVGSSVLVLEKNRMPAGEECRTLSCMQYALPGNLVMDFGSDFTVYPSDGVINIENISGEDINGDVFLFYKNFEYGLFIGGITYRARFTGGIKAGDIAQCLQQHYYGDTSAILYMSYAK